MHEIIPGILEKDFSEIEKKLLVIKPFSRRVHIDVLDGKFSPKSNFIDPTPFKKYKDDFSMEAHLMVDNPLEFLKPFADSGFKRFSGHIEKMKEIDEFIAQGQILGEVGLAIDISTPIESITIPYDDLDFILLLGVKAGESGQTFLPEVLGKIRKIREISQIQIEIDGGINANTIADCVKEGANRFIATSFIFENKDPMQAYEKLLSLSV